MIPMTQRTLHHADILPADTRITLTRATLTARRPRGLHDHDFTEMFWVQNGCVIHHLPDRRDRLTEGALVLLRPGQPHALQGKGEAPLVVSVALHPDLVARLDARLPPLAFWTAADGPAVVQRDSRQLADLNHAARLLERGPRDSLAAEAFILPLLADLVRAQTPLPADAPDWLAAACAAAHEPAVYRAGAAGLVARTGQSHPHVARRGGCLVSESEICTSILDQSVFEQKIFRVLCGKHDR